MEGNYGTDFTKARLKMLPKLQAIDSAAHFVLSPYFHIVFNDVPSEQLTWHHMEDCRTMQLVKFSVHDKKKHVGGRAIIENFPLLTHIFEFR